MRGRQSTNVQDWFCGSGNQPESCKNTAPTLRVHTTKWSELECGSQYGCPDGIPLTMNVNLKVTTRKRADCPSYTDPKTKEGGVCSGSMGRDDGLQRGACGCRTIVGQGATLSCTCVRGYYGDACQLQCPGATYTPGDTGLSNCCIGFFQRFFL